MSLVLGLILGVWSLKPGPGTWSLVGSRPVVGWLRFWGWLVVVRKGLVVCGRLFGAGVLEVLIVVNFGWGRKNVKLSKGWFNNGPGPGWRLHYHIPFNFPGNCPQARDCLPRFQRGRFGISWKFANPNPGTRGESR